MNKLSQWATSRRGATTLILAVLFLALRGTNGSLSLANALVTFPVVYGLVWVVAALWEGKTAPATPAFAREKAAGSSRQLREDLNATIFVDRGGFLFARRYFFVGTGCPPVQLTEPFARKVQVHRPVQAILVATTPARRYWAYQTKFAWENRDLESRDVMALLHEQERRRARGLENAHVLLNVAEGNVPSPPRQRQPIPRDVKHAVFSRDGGHCVECESNFEIQYDHIIPWSMGGANTVENLQLLCSTCNQRKGATL